MRRARHASKAFQKVIQSQNTYIAEGLIDDCENLVQKCLQHSKLNFEKFCDLWKEMNFACVFYATTSGAELAELSEEAIYIAKYYLVTLNNNNNIEESVAGLFMVYAFLNLQPYPRFAALRLVQEDMPAIERLEMLARKERRHDILYILGEVLIRGPCQFHVSARERAIDKPISKYFDGTTQTNAGALRPVGVFNRHNEEVGLIKELGQLEKRYNESKKRITDPSSNDQSLNYTEYTAVELEMTLRSIVAGILVEPKTDNDKKIEAEIRKNIQPEENRNDAVKSIKDRAMKSTVDSMKHLTGLEERKPGSPQKSTPDPPTPKGKGKGKGRPSTKTLNPLIDLPLPPPIIPPSNPESQKSLQRILDDNDIDINDINANKTSPAKTALTIPKEPYRKRGLQMDKSPTIPEKRKKTERSVIPTTKRAKQIEIEISPTLIPSINDSTNIPEVKKRVRKRPKKSETNEKTESPKVVRNSPLNKRNSQNIPLNIPVTPKSARKIPALIPITPTSAKKNQAGISKTPTGAKKRLAEAFESPTPANKVATKKPKDVSSSKKAQSISDIGSPTLNKSETLVSAKNNALKKEPQKPSKGNRPVTLIENPARNTRRKKSLSPQKELKTKTTSIKRGKRAKAKARSVSESDSNSDCDVTVHLSSDDEHENIDDESQNEKSNVEIPIDSQTDKNSPVEQEFNANIDTLPQVVDLQIDTLPTSVFTTDNGQIEIEIIDQFDLNSEKGKGSKSEGQNGSKKKTPTKTVSKVEISSAKTGVGKVVEELAQIVKIKDRKYQKKRHLRSKLKRLGVLSVADLDDEHDSS